MSEAICTHEGCNRVAIEILYPPLIWVELDPSSPTKEYLCTDHLSDKGFCHSCQEFVAGSEIWENPRAQQMKVCDDCWEEFCEECFTDFDEDNDYY
jgi:hypothetical protein